MTMKLRTGSVVVGLDGSEGAAKALAWAVGQAESEHRPLVIVSCGGQSRMRTAGLQGIDGRELADLAARVRQSELVLLHGAAADVRTEHPALDVDTVLVDSDPRTALVDASRTAHLVVVGSRGHGPVTSVLLGSVSRYVAEHAQCPVVVVRDQAGQAPRRGVVVGVDWTPGSVPVAEFAFAQASVRGVPLTVMHAMWSAPTALTDRPLTRVDDDGGLGALLGQTVAGLREKYPEVPVHFELRRGLADDCLTELAPRAELVVVGRPPHHVLGRILDGSTALSLVEHARGVVAVVPEAPPG